MNKPFYIDSEGHRVELEISTHAKERFVERWRILKPNKPLDLENIDNHICALFSTTQKVICTSSHELKRLAKYGADTLFYRRSDFTFVVSGKTIVTIEISDNGKRYLNSCVKPVLHPVESSTDCNAITPNDLDILKKRVLLIRSKIVADLKVGKCNQHNNIEYDSLQKILKFIKGSVEGKRSTVSAKEILPKSNKRHIKSKVAEFGLHKGKLVFWKEVHNGCEYISFQQMLYEMQSQRWKSYPKGSLSIDEINNLIYTLKTVMQSD